MMLAFALAMHVWVNDALSYRCVPNGRSIPALAGDPYFRIYGISFFFSPYNNDFCGAK